MTKKTAAMFGYAKYGGEKAHFPSYGHVSLTTDLHVCEYSWHRYK